MEENQILNVRKGIWIDERWLQKAGLGGRLRVEMRPGELRIQSASDQAPQTHLSDKAWDTFRTLGDDAASGCLKNAAENHDQYLYGKKT